MERFWSKVQKGDGCWLWQAGTVRGYGQFWLNGGPHKAHRIAYELAIGPIPEGLLVCHACDEKLCVRPDHLFLGTDADNQHDAVRKGRKASGERNGRAVLTVPQVVAIRAAFAGGASKKQLARDYGVSRPVIQDIIARRKWKTAP